MGGGTFVLPSSSSSSEEVKWKEHLQAQQKCVPVCDVQSNQRQTQNAARKVYECLGLLCVCGW